MEDITAEAGLSSGSTYLYFANKDELVRAAIEESLRQFEGLIEAVDGLAGPSVAAYASALIAALDDVRNFVPEVDLFRLAVHGWAFAQTDAESAQLIQRSAARTTVALERGLTTRLTGSPSDEIDAAARGLLTMLLGEVVRRALLPAQSVPSGAVEMTALVQLWIGPRGERPVAVAD